MKYLFLAVFAILSAFTGHSQSAQFRACAEKDQTQTGLDRCAGKEAARADADLNRIYQELRSKAKQLPRATEKIEIAERAWIQYRDAYLDAMFPAEDKQAHYGSIFPMDFDLLHAELTQEQTKRLSKLIKQYDQEAQ